MTSWYRYLIGVRGGGGRDHWAKQLEQRLSGLAASPLGPDGELLDVSGGQMGVYRLAEVEVVKEAFSGAAWLRAAPCPWLGELQGWVSWEWWHGYHSFDDRRFLINNLLRGSWGVVVRTDLGEWFDPVAERAFELTNVIEKHGFEGGSRIGSKRKARA